MCGVEAVCAYVYLSMSISLCVQKKVEAQVSPSARVLDVAVMFGLSLDTDGCEVIVPPTELTLVPGQVVFITGVSGGGKSTLLRLCHDALVERGGGDVGGEAGRPGVVNLDLLPRLPDVALVDGLARPECESGLPEASLKTVCGWLSLAGLNDAAVMLRRPRDLSEGQRHRLRLAQGIGVAERGGHNWSVLLADEFGSSLDRTTAFGLARSVRRWVSRSGLCFVAATAHDDLLEPLDPDVLVEVGPGGVCSVHARGDG